ncbi:hypothetical protein BMS3Bbin08_00417 [bacterium BMS3Bbin08]|nr:hypothetical protein BMS3Bbin08_00417 [bacterium BMS3Bbin08]
MPEPYHYVNGNITPALVKQLYADAESALKLVERVAEEVTIPTINQLRYAGQHLTRFISANDKEELRKAANHCQRAMYDAYETGIIYFINEINNFGKDYRKTVISKILPGWVGYQQTVDKIKTFVDNRNEKERHRQTEECKENFKSLNIIFNETKYSRDELNKTIKKDRIITFGVIIALIALIFVALDFFGINGEKVFTTDTKAKNPISTLPKTERISE